MIFVLNLCGRYYIEGYARRCCYSLFAIEDIYIGVGQNSGSAPLTIGTRFPESMIIAEVFLVIIPWYNHDTLTKLNIILHVLNESQQISHITNDNLLCYKYLSVTF